MAEAEAEAQLSSEGAKLKKATEEIELALGLAESCPDAYLRAQPDVRKLWNQAFFRMILVSSGPSAQAEAVYEEPFAALLDAQGWRRFTQEHNCSPNEI